MWRKPSACESTMHKLTACATDLEFENGRCGQSKIQYLKSGIGWRSEDMRKAMGFAALVALAFVFTANVYAEEGEHGHREKKDAAGGPWTGVFETKDGKCYFKAGENEVAAAAGEKATEDAKTKLNSYAEQ